LPLSATQQQQIANQDGAVEPRLNNNNNNNNNNSCHHRRPRSLSSHLNTKMSDLGPSNNKIENNEQCYHDVAGAAEKLGPWIVEASKNLGSNSPDILVAAATAHSNVIKELHGQGIKEGMQLHKEGMQSIAKGIQAIAFSIVVSSLVIGFAMYTSAMHISK
jgi:hypothetical protein